MYCFSNFFACGPPLSLMYLCVSPPFIDTVAYEKKLLYSHIVDLCIYIYISLINNTELFNISFRYTFYTYTK
jgi:hypothetical protein